MQQKLLNHKLFITFALAKFTKLLNHKLNKCVCIGMERMKENKINIPAWSMEEAWGGA